MDLEQWKDTECRRESTEAGADFCVTCSDYLQEWVIWEGHRNLVRTVQFLRTTVNLLTEEVGRYRYGEK